MIRLPTLMLLSAFCIISLPLSAIAQSEENSGAQQKINMEEISIKQKAYELMDAIDERVSRDEHRHFMRLYGNYNLLETVSTVREDVESAVKACGENNPHIKNKIEERYNEWDGVIDPVMVESKANLNNMIIAQDYATKEELDQVFDALVEARDSAANQIKKIPVTTEEACLFLLGKMDETQEHMLKILKSTLASFPPPSPEPEETPAKDDAEAG